MKGISPVIASIILILIVITLSSSYLVFTGRLASEQQSSVEEQTSQVRRTATTLFHIEAVQGQKVTIVNDGLQELDVDSFVVELAGTRMNHTASGDIATGERGELTVKELWRIGRGEYTLTVRSGSSADSMPVRVEPADGRVLDLRFEEGSGDKTFDASGNDNDGTLKPNSTTRPDWVSGRIGSALDFDGSNDYIEVLHSASLNPTTLTIEQWIKTDLPPSAGAYQYSVSKRHPNNLMEGYQTLLHAGGNQFRAILSNSTTDVNCLTTSVAQANTWYHWVVRFDGTNIQNYINGVPDNNPTYACTFSGTLTLDTKPLAIGSEAQAGFRFNGLIDELRIYSVALTPDELYVLKRR